MRREVIRYFERGTDNFFDIADDIIDRIDEDDFINEDSYDAVSKAVDEGLIYTNDQWEVLKHYCNPSDADFDYAIEEFINDIVNIAEEIFG